MFTNKEFILASSSRSRFQILKNSGFIFKQVKPLCDEEFLKDKISIKNKTPQNISKILSYEKSKSISKTKEHSNKLVIGCDTIVFMKKKIFNKAKNIKEAHKKILQLSGREHKIVSGITICTNGKKIWQSQEVTRVKIRKLSKKEIDNYLKSAGKQILQSAGCYQIEALGPKIIEDINGDFFNVMGLPLFKLLNFVYKIR